MKPLSEKSLYKLYEQAKIKEEEKALLKKYLLCFSNLYGCIQICDLWDVFSSYHEPISKKKLFDFIDINQREENEYFILNLNEPYSAETSTKTKDKLLVNKLLVKRYTYKFNDLYTL